MSEIVLPTERIAASKQSPKNLIIFSKPKVGKSTILAGLDNCLLLDLEEGSDYVAAMKLQARNVDDIREIGKKIKEAGHPYKYIAIDTVTALEEIAIPYAEEIYSKTPMGSSWFKMKDGKLDPDSGKAKYGNIIGMPNGAGYMWLRQAYEKLVDHIKTWAPHLIQLGHVKDTVLEKNGAEFNSLDLDLTGKLKRIASSKSDAIAYLYRKGNKNILSFKTSDEVSCGARPEHLRNKEIVISELTKEGVVVTHWDEIFID